MGQIGKQILTIAVLLMAIGASEALRAASIVTAIVTDPLTGVAIEGYDPVSYFTEPEPKQGLPDYEFIWGGVPWYFANAANRDVFMRAPDVYAPQYGGHCTMSLARGYLSDGKPAIYAVRDGRLHLFYSAANREAFLMTEAGTLTAAAANWATLSRTLTTQ